MGEAMSHMSHAEEARLRAENKWLRACMEHAGLAAFLRGRDPGEIAEHLHKVIKSHSDAADRAAEEIKLLKAQIRDLEKDPYMVIT